MSLPGTFVIKRRVLFRSQHEHTTTMSTKKINSAGFDAATLSPRLMNSPTRSERDSLGIPFVCSLCSSLSLSLSPPTPRDSDGRARYPKIRVRAGTGRRRRDRRVRPRPVGASVCRPAVMVVQRSMLTTYQQGRATLCVKFKLPHASYFSLNVDEHGITVAMGCVKSTEYV